VFKQSKEGESGVSVPCVKSLEVEKAIREGSLGSSTLRSSLWENEDLDSLSSREACCGG
jgi:hypothetical protein